MKQTAVEYAVNWLTPFVSVQQKYIDELLKEAKEMEKENTIAFADKYDAYVVQGGTLTAEQYYNETYGGEK